MRRPTIPVHGGAPHARPGDPVVTPISQSVSYVQEPGTSDAPRYTRYGNVPNIELVERRLAMLEGAEAAVVLSSGMGATACAMLALLRPGDHLLSSSWIYGGTHKLFTQELAGMGIDVTLVDPLAPRSWRREMRQTTRAIFVESPVNPTCRVLDLSFLANLAKDSGVALVVDSTFASPVNFRPHASHSRLRPSGNRGGNSSASTRGRNSRRCMAMNRKRTYDSCLPGLSAVAR